MNPNLMCWLKKVYKGVRLTRCLDSDRSSHEYGFKPQGIHITH